MINLSEVVNDSDLAESFTIQRTTGSFGLGGWILSTPVNVPGYGIITVASNEDLQMVPEGDRVTGSMIFHSMMRIYETELDGGYGSSIYGDNDNPTNTFGPGIQHFSDQIRWRGQLYKIISVAPWADFGYWRVIGTRLSGR